MVHRQVECEHGPSRFSSARRSEYAVKGGFVRAPKSLRFFLFLFVFVCCCTVLLPPCLSFFCFFLKKRSLYSEHPLFVGATTVTTTIGRKARATGHPSRWQPGRRWHRSAPTRRRRGGHQKHGLFAAYCDQKHKRPPQKPEKRNDMAARQHFLFLRTDAAHRARTHTAAPPLQQEKKKKGSNSSDATNYGHTIRPCPDHRRHAAQANNATTLPTARPSPRRNRGNVDGDEKEARLCRHKV